MAEAWRALSHTRRAFARAIHYRDANTPGYLCPKCGRPIDWALPWPHPYSPSVGHTIELQDGGALLDPANARSEHLTCNSAAGSVRAAEKRREARQSYALHVDPATL
jgi:hypothetical protein